MERFRLVMVFAVLVAGIHISVNAQKKNVTIEKVAFSSVLNFHNMCNKFVLFGVLKQIYLSPDVAMEDTLKATPSCTA